MRYRADAIKWEKRVREIRIRNGETKEALFADGKTVSRESKRNYKQLQVIRESGKNAGDKINIQTLMTFLSATIN